MFETILAGVIVFVFGQFILKLVLDPIVSFKQTLGEISAYFLREQAKLIAGSPSVEIQDKLKFFASSLFAHKQAIPFYKFLSRILGMPTEDRIVNSCKSLNLIGCPDVTPEQVLHEMNNISSGLKITTEYTDL